MSTVKEYLTILQNQSKIWEYRAVQSWITSKQTADSIENLHILHKFTNSRLFHFYETEVVWHEFLSVGPLPQFHNLGCFKTISLLFLTRARILKISDICWNSRFSFNCLVGMFPQCLSVCNRLYKNHYLSFMVSGNDLSEVCQAIIWWNAGSWTLGNKLQWHLNQIISIFETVYKMVAMSRPQCVKWN